MSSILSRHNLRIKIVQAAYEHWHLIDEKNPKDAHVAMNKTFHVYFREGELMLCFFIDLVWRVAHYAFEDVAYKKLLHTKQRLFFEKPPAPRIATHPIVTDMYAQMQAFHTSLAGHKNYAPVQDEDIIKKLFYTLKKTPSYENYISAPEGDKEAEKEVARALIEDIIFQSTAVESLLEDRFLTAYEDASELINYLLKYVAHYHKGAPVALAHAKENSEFAERMAGLFITHRRTFLNMILPKTQKNWEEDRLCVIDKILLCLGLCEFLYCDEIPARVSMNEYIDIAKEYSTEKSKFFVNGILDGLYKELYEAGRIAEEKA